MTIVGACEIRVDRGRREDVLGRAVRLSGGEEKEAEKRTRVEFPGREMRREQESGITSKKLRKRAERGGAERIKFLGSRVLRLWIARR